MARSCHVQDSSGGDHEVKAIFVNVAGHTHEVKAAWVRTPGGKEQWWPPPAAGGGGHPPTSHTSRTVTLGGHKSGRTWTFNIGPYAGKITHASLIVTTVHTLPHVVTGTTTGIVAHIHQNIDSTKGYTVSAHSLSGSQRSAVFPVDIYQLISRVTLRLSYTI